MQLFAFCVCPAAQSVYLEPQLQPFCLAQCHQLSPLQCQR